MEGRTTKQYLEKKKESKTKTPKENILDLKLGHIERRPRIQRRSKEKIKKRERFGAI